jgi:hypothetical protein
MAPIKKPRSNAMLQRMAALESRLGRVLVARVAKTKVNKALGAKRNQRKPGANAGMRFGADSSGLNKSVGFTNRSMLEQRFETRMEKVCNVVGTTAFTIAQALYLNPGNTSLFPIFSQEAAVYEQYRTNVFRFWYRSREYTASGSNIGAGLVLMATNFDPDDPQFTSDTQMENYWHCTSDAPFAPSGKGVLVHDVLAGHRAAARRSGARDSTLNNYYVNSSANLAAPGSNAAKFYDVGLFQFATSGNVNSSDVIGELWVEYSFTMIHPKQQTPIAANVVAAHYTGTAASGTNPLPANLVSRPGSTLGLTFPTTTTCVVSSTFTGRLLFQMFWNTASANIAASAGVSASAGGTLVNYLAANTASSNGQFAANGASSSLILMVDCVNGATLTLTGLTSMTSATVDVIASQISSGLTLTKAPALLTSSQYSKLARVLAAFEDDDEPAFDRGDGVIAVSEPVTPALTAIPTSHVPVGKLLSLLSTLSK